MSDRLRERCDRFRRALAEAGADAALISPGPDMYYLSGFRGEHDRYVLLYVPRAGDPAFVTPGDYEGQIGEATWIDAVHTVPANDVADVAAGAGSLLDDGVDVRVDGGMPVALAHELRDEAATIRPLGDTLQALRRRKDPGEIGAMRRAAAVADEVSEAVRGLGDRAIGTTERELADEIRGRLHERGGERLSFDVVVGSGPNSARPFRRHGDRMIRTGDPVVLDFGAFVDNYASDQTRVVVFDGAPPTGFEAVHEATLAALEAGAETVQPGIEAGAVDRAVRDAIDEHGFADGIVHATGHGVGLEAHEPLSIEADSDTELRPGMTFSIEPGIYLDDFGVRLEDLVAVTEGGCERLNRSPRTWRPL